MPDHLVSVMMAVYNSETYLKEAIDSILNQTYKNFEFIIANDGSKDRSRDIILSYTDPRIVYIENRENLGIVATRNKCIDISKGKYIAVLDSDDIALPSRLEKQVKFMESNPEYGLCGTYFKVINKKGKKLYNVKFPITDFELKTYLHFGNCFCHSTILLRTQLAQSIRYPEAFQLGEDYALWQSISSVSKVYNLPFFSTYYRIHTQNISSSKHEEMFEAIKRINEQNLKKLNIEFSDSDIINYSKFLIFNHTYFTPENNFNELKNFLAKIILKIKSDPNIANLVVLKFFLDRWFVLCFKTRRYQLLFLNKLFHNNKYNYLKFFSAFMLAQYKKIINSN